MINSRGVVVGTTRDVLFEYDQMDATIWTGGKMVRLSSPQRTWWRAINNRDWVVGNRWSEATLTRPILWLPRSGVASLPLRGGVAGHAADINDSGQVVGTVSLRSGEMTMVMWRVRP